MRFAPRYMLVLLILAGATPFHPAVGQGNPISVQLELSQRCYMVEKTREYDGTRAVKLVEGLKCMLSAFIEAGATRHRR